MNNHTTSSFEMFKIATGEIASSLIVNGLNTFAMIYFTSALGLSPAYAGLALSISIFWDAVTDLLMGYISDNTKSKYGKRVPYIIFGGIVMLLVNYFFWNVPDLIRASQQSLFIYLVAINILLKTFFTIYFVPFGAMVLDIFVDFDERTKIQSMRTALMQIANFAGPGISWFIFFPRVEDVSNLSSYAHMSIYFTILGLVALFLSVKASFKYITPSNNNDSEKMRYNFKKVLKDFTIVFKNKKLIIIFIFGMLVLISQTMVAALQLYLYSYYMMFDGLQKTIVNGGTMLGAALGAALGSYFAHKYSKRNANYIAMSIAVTSGVLLCLSIIFGIIVPGTLSGIIIFAAGNIGFWLGNTMTTPLLNSMIADTAEVSFLQTGVAQEGTYTSVYSFSIKMAQSLASFLTGILLTFAGFDSSLSTQTSETIDRLVFFCFILGPGVMLLGIPVLRLYPLTKEKLMEIREYYSK